MGFLTVQENPRGRLGCWVGGSVHGGPSSVRRADRYVTHSLALTRPADGFRTAEVTCAQCRRSVEVTVACARQTRLARTGWLSLAVVGLILIVLTVLAGVSLGWDNLHVSLVGIPAGFLFALAGFARGLTYDGLSVAKGSFHKIFPEPATGGRVRRPRRRREVERLEGPRRYVAALMVACGMLGLLAFPVLLITGLAPAAGATLLASILLIGAALVDGPRAFAVAVSALVMLAVAIVLFARGMDSAGWDGIGLAVLLFGISQIISAITRRRS